MLKTRPIRLLIVDDHPVVREGLRACLTRHPQLEVIGECTDGLDAVTRAPELAPDVILLDYHMPRMRGPEAAAILAQSLPATKILVLTIADTRECITSLVSSGVHGYVLKEAAPEELVRAIETVHSGQSFFSARIAPLIRDAYLSASGRTRQSLLSPREREVLARLANGRNNREIATEFGLSVRTVETHRERIMHKLNIHNVAGLTKYAISEGLVEAS